MIRPTLVVLGILALAAPLLAEKGANTKQVLSPTYTIDKIYRSMEGPASSQKVYLGDPDKPELIWITGLKTEMVGEDGKTAQLPELMCHVNVDLDAARHQAMLGLKRPVAARLVTLSQGMLSAKVPAGFGFPIASNEPLVLFTQVLNHNIVHPENIKVRHRVTIEYVRDRDLAQPLKPLFNVGASGSVLLDSANALNTSMPGMPGAGAAPSSSMPAMPGMGAGANPLAVDAGGQHGASCLLLPRAPNAGAGGGSDYTDPQGRKLTGHWIVPPGRQVNHSDITWFMALPYDTVLHYAAVHLHPFAESLTLRDMTTDETLFTAKALGPRKGVGLTHVDTFSSQKGLPLYRNHKYELISVYNNSTRETHDSMASVFLGLEDPEFEHPTRELLEERAADMVVPTNDTGVIVRTSSGDFGIQLYPDRAPAAVRAFVRLVRAHAYDHARFSRVVPDDAVEVKGNGQLNATQYLAIATRLETTLKHETGSISLCPGEASFAIVIGPGGGRDGRCAVVGRVGPGSGLIGQIANAPR
ncbi:MAG: peptidylprolyl isomerase, partial [Acidobacteriota bacterium]